MGRSWNHSNRKAQLPKNWKMIRQEVLLRDSYHCTERDQYGFRCEQPASDVDHIVRGSDHRIQNLRSLCKRHHTRKSSSEGNAAKKRFSKKHPGEPNPGLK